MKHRIQLQTTMGAIALDVQAEFMDEIIVLSGENGAGKSTLLRCIAGLEQVTGYIYLHQKVWLNSSVNVKVEDRRLGFVWPQASLLPWLTVEKNIQLGVVNEDRPWFAQLAEEFEIDRLLQRKPEMLSTGEAQRVSLVRAIYRRPDMLLLDEPFSAQAPDIRGRIRRVLQRLQQQLKIPVILVSHDGDDARVLAHQHWHMREGKLLKEVQERRVINEK